MRTAYIGMGANLPSCAGSPEATLAAAEERLAALGRVAAKSSLYSTEPVGYTEQPRFVNAVVALETEASARQLLDALMRIEKELGRDRANAIPNGPRTLDLDILLFGDSVIDEPGLRIPHPRLAERAFVLVPLNEIAPEAVEPRIRRTIRELLQDFSARAGEIGNDTQKVERVGVFGLKP
ncbi:MAG TPA: 2-amino-4-hydroxy-6-hydroxymethyldihydropteridine diphosphokinase [Terracidiphilus sp.]|nr:2-amino-4-hydroxy-6-hydroxymethyldihydropteridine diphosphokinase [Terracidiphilus sp.]